MNLKEMFQTEQAGHTDNFEDLESKKTIILLLALEKVPDDIVEMVLKRCMIVTDPKDCFGWCMSVKDMQRRKITHMIFLSKYLWSKSIEYIQHCFLHEVSHIHLNHKETDLISDKESQANEKEADDQASEWLGYTLESLKETYT